MTIGTAIVIVMLLYLLDKHGLLKRAAVIIATLTIVGLGWIYGQKQYKSWQLHQYLKHQEQIKTGLITKYHNALPPARSDGKTISVPIDELANIPSSILPRSNLL